MRSHTLPIFLLFLAATVTTTKTATVTAIASSTKPATINFIKSKCSTTSYPIVCVQTLSYYSDTIQKSQRQMAQTALTISLDKARHANKYVTQLSHTKGLRPKEVGVIQDCLEQVCDTVDRLGKSVHEFQMAGRVRSRDDFKWHMSNVQTWASAALTDISTCVDESKKCLNKRIKLGIKTQFKGVIQCTSNALSLVNQFANK